MKTQTAQPIEETPISELSWENLLARREAINSVLENLEAELKVISDEFLFRLQEEKISGKVVGNSSISKATRVSFSTSLDDARALGAIKEAVDNEVLKKLYYQKVDVPGVRVTEYVMVRDVVKKKTE